MKPELGCLFAKELMERSFIEDEEPYFEEKPDGTVE